ncbi:hypothetical protein [Morganella morganii]|uniref:hypothetical protein n=1 Tax=Morganella morganii TaxID=582 RepID=UPI001BDAC22A|nr:hypothetical protein [Morganella morganii]MBT0362759.1 hypothetical protein [Morganella morganii subsp. morganii]
MLNEREISLIKTIGESVSRNMSEFESRLERQIDALKRENASLSAQLEQLRADNAAQPEAVTEERIKTIAESCLSGRSLLNTGDADCLIEEKVRKAFSSITVPEQQDIRGIITDILSELPVPKDGRDGRDGRDGKDGTSITAEEIKPLVESAVRSAVSELPVPKDGRDGRDGKDGEDGTSITAEEIKPLVESAVRSAVSELPVPKDGKDGRDGKDGEDGTSITAEEIKPLVESAVRSAVSELPVPKDGKDGRDGRDAFDIEILPGIDESRSYARGTIATHNGGLWRAYEQTQGMRGWECIVRGHCSHLITVKDIRTLLIKSQMSDGETFEAEHTFPVMIYKNVYKTGKTYQQGDVVTWGGSLWHCHTPTSDKPGELNSVGWTLIVKRGRDGKDAK